MKLLERVKKTLEQSHFGSNALSLAERGLLSLVPVAADVYRRLRNWSDNHLGDVPGHLHWPSAPAKAREAAPATMRHSAAAQASASFQPPRRAKASPPARRPRKPRASRRKTRKLPGRLGVRAARATRKAAGQSAARPSKRRRG